MTKSAPNTNTEQGNEKQLNTTEPDVKCELGEKSREKNYGDSMEGKGSEEEEKDQTDILREDAGDFSNLRWHVGRVGAFDVSLYGADVITDGVQFATHTSN